MDIYVKLTDVEMDTAQIETTVYSIFPMNALTYTLLKQLSPTLWRSIH